MFETQEHIDEQVNDVYALTTNLQRGEVLTHEAIRDALCCEPHEGSWDHVVNRARRRLEAERGIATWPDVTVGYRLLTKDEQLTFLPHKRARKGLRQARKTKRSVMALSPRNLTMHQAKLRQREIERCNEQVKALRKILAEQKSELDRPTKVLPRNRG